MVKPNRFHVFAALTCMYAILIFYLSSRSSLPGPSEIGFMVELAHLLEAVGLKPLTYPLYPVYRYPDKFAHMALYCGFGLLLNLTLRSSKNGLLNGYAVPFAIAIGTLYAVTDEFHQAFVAYRTASSLDLVADFIGLLLAQLLISIYFGIKRL